MKFLQLIVLVLFTNLALSQQTKIQYLCGTGFDHTVNWEFFCSARMNSGHWATIAVPSCWEQQGFGSYNYGHDKLENRMNETGLYRTNFIVPAEWKTKQVNIVFDGVMTDAEVKINGKPAGPVHQGSFYQFKYDISKLLKYGAQNKLEVFVKKHSENASVNEAERTADFWIFGGIFRPVFLEANPLEHIQRVAIDARANGDFTADIYLSPVKNASLLKVEIQTLSGKTETEITGKIASKKCRISGRMNSPKTWNPETPNLYKAVFTLLDEHNTVIHQHTEKFGFRTIEVRESDGIYVNGERIKMKGVCRHTFHPKYGRTSSKKFSIEVVNLMKDMNMNAVRMSHYPPDSHFLEVCDSLGLFVLDELCAWQWPSYDDVVGRKLLEEMIAHDVNHPSVILWDNGNEGGENNNLNDDFAKLDIQQRKVLHPWQDYDLTNTLHYISYNYLAHDGFSKRKIFFPTEFLHGLYDGGSGAGLDDYWIRMWDDPLCAGGFLWVFADEAIERTDRNGQLDTDGNHAPDGVLGPYHEKEGSFYTIKEIWSPVYFEKRYITPEFDGTFRIENRYHYTNLDQCLFTSEWVKVSNPDEEAHEKLLAKNNFKIKLEPGQKGKIEINRPANWANADVLRIKAVDPYGRILNTWCWPVKYPGAKAKELLVEKSSVQPVLQEKENTWQVQAGEMNYSFSKKDGTLLDVKNKKGIIPLSGGPVFVSEGKEVQNVSTAFEGNNLVIKALLAKGDSVKWTISGNGLLDLDVAYQPENNCLFAGISFNFPEKNIAGMKWLGNGPYRVWKNRMKGVEFGLWGKDYNRTITGESGYEYPEFKGYHSETYWAKFLGKDCPDFKVYVHSKDIFLRMFTPDEPQSPANTKLDFPKGDISFLHGINAIGTKFKVPESYGPQSNRYEFAPSRIHGGKLNMKLTFDFR
ncbi:MAG: hypothetical protein A2W90_05055 [Bacteroidetes bacterium GWF2_42_66]|nr:MAG: hypothetical protein A2W89_02465 [Bacteroidetes bacterium GWE2_42_39]OFY46525.1 MAG: hypothetical protein A2W90_05055 [Bacteroidetes bacterium GWF2_42_66]HBL75622.1 beta-galactosidase [Prolixibacteraceae bacterium]HCU62649.1 beta-galactosidase [Prolixibacteraceae bacterium]